MMGTSTSSSGPRSNINFDPPWLRDTSQNDNRANASDGESNKTEFESKPIDISPPRRFANARRELGAFVRTGDKASLARAIGHYSKSGMGGAKRLASRMRASTTAASALVALLTATQVGGDSESVKWVQDLQAKKPTSDDVANAIIAKLAPNGGSADEESLKNSMALAISDLILTQPNIELLNMSYLDILTLLKFFLGHEVCSRLEFDMGQFFESSRLKPVEAVQREIEMREFVRNEIGEQLKKLSERNPNPTKQELDQLIQDAVRMTFEVYEDDL